MSLSTITAVAAQAVEQHHEQVIAPWIVGAGALGILLLALGALIVFGGGREHS